MAAPRKKAGTFKTLSFLLVVLLIIAAGAWLWHVNRSPGNAGSNNNASHTSQPTTTHSPDPVKDSTGPNTDTMPSSNGTGPGSSNSLLGQ